VLKMVDVEFIKKKQADGWSIRKIARQLEVSRQTVRKVLAAPAEPPRYHLLSPRPRPVAGAFHHRRHRGLRRWSPGDAGTRYLHG
jgi:transposase